MGGEKQREQEKIPVFYVFSVSQSISFKYGTASSQ